MNITTNYGQLLLKDKEVQTILKGMILQKANCYDIVSKKILSEKEFERIIQGQITPATLYKILDHDITKDERILLKRDLSSMCHHLNKSRNKG